MGLVQKELCLRLLRDDHGTSILVFFFSSLLLSVGQPHPHWTEAPWFGRHLGYQQQVRAARLARWLSQRVYFTASAC